MIELIIVNGILMKNEKKKNNQKIPGIRKITIPRKILPAYICPVPGIIRERRTAMASSLRE